MLLSNLAPLFCLAVSVFAQDDGSQFYGYGSGLMGYPLFYSDGGAYIGISPPANAGYSTNISLTQDADNGSFTASPINSTVTSNWTTPKLAIDNTSGAYSSVRFSSSDNATLTTTGFDLWGTLLVWVSDSGDILTKWYADPVDEKNRTWELKWNTDNTISGSAVPVVLKNLAPASTRKMRR